MTISRLLRDLSICLAVLLVACQPSPEPAFGAEQRYKHDLYSPAECVRISQSNAEFSCSETVQFNPDGTAFLLLGGGDIVVRGAYQRQGRKITVHPSDSLPNEVVFTVVSDNELNLAGRNTRWLKY